MHRRSEEPAVTEVSCYWKKSKLSTVGTSLKYIKGKNIGKGQVQQINPKTGSFLSEVLEFSKNIGRNDTVLTKYSKEFTKEEKLSLHHLILSFFQSQDSAIDASDSKFLEYCSSEMSEIACHGATERTVLQDKNKLWYELRYGRITASKAYESAHCQTLNGSLVEHILGASSIKDTYAMQRGKRLENEIRDILESKIEVPIELCGLYLSPNVPIMGASPDGLTQDYVIEIKCPTSEKAMKKYVQGDKITEKFKAQIQLQMHFTRKQKGLFCVASHNFETTKELFILLSHYEPQYCIDLIEKCTTFWKNAIYPILKQNN